MPRDARIPALVPGQLSRGATTAGLGALALWASLAVLTTGTGPVPPFQLTALTFALGGVVGLLYHARRLGPSGLRRALTVPRPVWLVGLGGLFGYHALYFTALRHAPPAEAGLFNYLWPLLLVLGTALLPGGRLRPGHVLGALLGFGGLLALGGLDAGDALAPEHLGGDACALAAAFVWAAYSLASRRWAMIDTAVVSAFSLLTAMLAGAVHLCIERPHWPESWGQWACLATLALGPTGLAFPLWDVGMKRGDLPLLGAAAYATPVASTALLVLFGAAAPTPGLALACACIVAGAVVAGRRAP